jgi:hypothetical protein
METTGRSLPVDNEVMVVFPSGSQHAGLAAGEPDNFAWSGIGRA